MIKEQSVTDHRRDIETEAEQKNFFHTRRTLPVVFLTNQLSGREKVQLAKDYEDSGPWDPQKNLVCDVILTLGR